MHKGAEHRYEEPFAVRGSCPVATSEYGGSHSIAGWNPDPRSLRHSR